ncbi:MAG: hypothetical protein ACK2UI_14775 [Anaerolineae bacterium]
MVKTPKRVFNWVWRGIAVTVSGFLLGVLGWLVGALIEGNLAQEFAFGGVRGYEAAGLVGYLVGTATGIIASCRILSRLRKPKFGSN